MTPEQFTSALVVLIPIIVSGIISLVATRNTARKDALATANAQIELNGARLDALQQKYDALWAQFQTERALWATERNELHRQIARLEAENVRLYATLREHGIQIENGQRSAVSGQTKA